MSFLSNPRAASTSLPLARLRISPAARDRSYAGRVPDRGGAVPVNGQSVRLPNGTVGGRPIPLPALRQGQEQASIPKVSLGMAQRLQVVVDRQLAANRVLEKMPVQVRPGVSALVHALAGPVRVDGNGKALYRWGPTDDIAPLETRGQLAQQRTAPRWAAAGVVRGRVTRNLSPPPYAAARGSVTPSVLLSPVSDATVAALSRAESPVVPSQGDQGVAVISPAPREQVTVGFGGNTASERLLFLGAVVLVAFLIFRKG